MIKGHRIEVKSVTLNKDDGVVKHVCNHVPDIDYSDLIGQIAVQNVDILLRNLHTSLHSAGHLLDAAVIKLGLYFFFYQKN